MLTLFLGTIIVSAEGVDITNIQNGYTYTSLDSIQVNTSGYNYFTYSLYKDGVELTMDTVYGLDSNDTLAITVPNENGIYLLIIYNADTMNVVKSINYIIDSDYIIPNTTYQQWANYPDSPAGTELSMYPYQAIWTYQGNARLTISTQPLYVNNNYLYAYNGVEFKIFAITSNTWYHVASYTSLNVTGSPFVEANNDVYADSSLTVVFKSKTTQEGNNFPSEESQYEYYIKDDANMFTVKEKVNLLELEKQIEQNCRMQFFIKTHSEPYTEGSEIDTIFTYANQKAPTGNGAYVIDIYKDNSNKKVYITVSTTEIMAIQLPAIGIINNIKRYIKYYADFSYKNISSVIDKTYWDLILNNVSRDLFAYTNQMITSYQLVNNKLIPKGYTEDEIFLSDIRKIIINDFIPSVQPSTIPTEPTPTPSGSPEPTYSPIPLPGIDINPGDFNLSGKTPLAPLKGALERLKQLKQSETPPVFKINLRSLINASTTTLSPGAGDALPDEETSYLDFGQLSVIQFGGYSLIQYFRTLIGALMVWFTIRYIWKGIVPDSTIGG